MKSSLSVDAETQAIRQVALRWVAAVANADLDELARLMTDDIVVIHGNGRTIEGRDGVLADFARSLQKLRIEQEVDFEETAVADEWAFDRAMVHTTIEQRSGGDRKRFEARTMTILRRLDQGDWRVARSIGVIIQSPASISDPDT